MAFEWDQTKNDKNIEKHGIDFDDAISIFRTDHHVFRSDRGGEERFVAIGDMEAGLTIAVIFTVREQRIRVISARRAKLSEERTYRQKISERDS